MDAIRSRTPTSAGMAAVVASQKEQVADPDAWLTFAYWDIVHDSFDVSRNDLRWMQAYLTRHLAAIVQDNLQGQCTTGHSCKVRTLGGTDNARWAFRIVLVGTISLSLSFSPCICTSVYGYATAGSQA